MYQAIIVVHILLGLGIIGLILMQQGKGADAGAGFGGGASGSVFGAQGAASFLSRSTAVLATLFFLSSLGLAWLNSNKNVVADFMSAPAAKQEAETDLGLPNVGGAETVKVPASPIPSSQPASSVTPESVTPPVTTTEAQPAAKEEKSVEAPKPSESAIDDSKKQPDTKQKK
jgi:preprotein translocase subunit SecG